MSKSMFSCRHKPPLKSHSSSEEPQNDENIKNISDYDRVRTRIPQPSAMNLNILARKCSSALALRRGIAPGAGGKRGQPSEPPRSTPWKVVKKSEKAAGFIPQHSPNPQLFASRKYTSSLAPHGRMSAGLEPSKSCAQPHVDRTEMPCKADEKSEKIYLENCRKSNSEPDKSSCCDAQGPRGRFCVSFQEPVAKDIPCGVPPVSDCPHLEPGHPTFSDSCEREKPHSRKSRGHCQRPVIVVPLAEGARSSSPDSFIPYLRGGHARSSSGSHHHEHRGSSPETDHHEHCEQPARSPCPIDQVSCPDSHHHSPHCSPGSPCANYSKIADLTLQLAELNRKWTRLQNDELPEIRRQMESLNANVKALTQKCAEKEVESLNVKALTQKCGEKKEPEPVCPNLERKSLSTCQFCKGHDLPLLDSFHVQLVEKIGPRSFSDVVISVFLRADNIYHVNVRELNSGSSLSCFLVTDVGIAEAQQLGFFRDILTFSVIDVRNTLKPRNNALGISFELVPSDRQKGGSDSLNRGICMSCKPFVARILGLPQQKMKYLYAGSENYPERALKRFQNRLAKIQANSPYSQADKVIQLSGKPLKNNGK